MSLKNPKAYFLCLFLQPIHCSRFMRSVENKEIKVKKDRKMFLRLRSPQETKFIECEGRFLVFKSNFASCLTFIVEVFLPNFKGFRRLLFLQKIAITDV